VPAEGKIMPSLHRLAVLLALLAAGCPSKKVPNGAVHCSALGACPTGLTCFTDGLCYYANETPAGQDMSAAQCVVNGVKDGSETDVDCGGGCAPCAVGLSCGAGSDCASGFCGANQSCAADGCHDGVKDGSETDIDCGGGTCDGCVVGKSCGGDADCASMSCDPVAKTCTSAQCSDGVKNGNETDLDCGGGVCAPCTLDQGCAAGRDCVSTFCNTTTGKCVADQCHDGVKDGSETDVDCGGSSCAGCALGQGCGIANGNCASMYCVGGVCVDQCHNGAKDGNESDIDCGGATCGGCVADKACAAAGDCNSGRCLGTPSYCVPVALGWTRLAELNQIRDGAMAAVGVGAGDARVYALGGAASTVGAATNTVEAWTPDAWTPLSGLGMVPVLPHARENGGAAVGSDGKIYVLGGVDGSGALLAAVDTYAPNAWTSTATNLPTMRRYVAAAAPRDGSTIYAVGGMDSGSNALNTFEAYSVAAGTWKTSGASQVPALPAARLSLSAVVDASGRVYAMGGTNMGAFGTTQSTVYRWTPGDASWSPVASLLAPRQDAAGVLGADNRIYLISGYSGGSVTSVDTYSPTTNQWVSWTALDLPHSTITGTIGPDGRVYALGGNSSQSGTNDEKAAEAYGPIVTTSAASASAGTSINVSGTGFAASAKASIYLVPAAQLGPSGTPLAAGLSTDGAGALASTAVMIPAGTTLGFYRIVVIDNKSEYPANRYLSVN
jgi:hypothetical protein